MPRRTGPTGQQDLLGLVPHAYHYALTEPQGPFLGTQKPEDKGKKTLVLDLDETLVHTSYLPLRGTSFVVEIYMDCTKPKVKLYVSKRPGVDKFLAAMAKDFEIVMFTASVQNYANPIMDVLDSGRPGKLRLFRDACTLRGDKCIKDLSKLGRHLKDVIIVDNNPYSYCLQPDNGLNIESWFDNPEDEDLDWTARMLEGLAHVYDIRETLRSLDIECEEDEYPYVEPISSGDEMSAALILGKGA